MGKENKINETPLFEKLITKSSLMKERKNIIFYLSIISLDICAIILASAVYCNYNGIMNIDDVLRNFDNRFTLLILGLIVVCFLLNIFPDYFMIWTKTRKRSFGSVISGDIRNKFYSGLMLYGQDGVAANVHRLANSGIDGKIAIEVGYSKKIIGKIAQLLYWMLVLIVGVVFAFDSVPLYIFVFAIISFVLLVSIVVYVLFANKQKERYIAGVGRLVRFLYKIKLIKDYEKLYNCIVERLAVCGTVLKNKKSLIITQLLCCIFKELIRSILLISIIGAFDVFDWDCAIEIIFKLTLIDLIVGILPLPSGLVAYELIFLLLLGGVVSTECVVWVMVTFRLCDYYINAILMSVVVAMDSVFEKQTKKRRGVN